METEKNAEAYIRSNVKIIEPSDSKGGKYPELNKYVKIGNHHIDEHFFVAVDEEGNVVEVIDNGNEEEHDVTVDEIRRQYTTRFPKKELNEQLQNI